MVSILPNQRTPFDAIGADVGRALQGVLPGAVQQGYQRGQGLSAIDQLQQALGAAGGDINQILPALAKAYTLNPNLERSGLGQQYLQQSRVGQLYGQQGQHPSNQQVNAPSQSASSSPFNISTPEDMVKRAEEGARILNDPAAYDRIFAQEQAKNREATALRNDLEEVAKSVGIKDVELPRFLQAGKNFDIRNPSEWAQKTLREFNKIKAADKRLEKAFIPGIGSGLLGRNRDELLKRLHPDIRDLANQGQEQEVRQFLKDNFLSETEIEEAFHPLSKQNESSIKELKKGIFPADTTKNLSYFGDVRNPEKSYEEVEKKNPKLIKEMNDRLVDFFRDNITPETSLLVLRDKLWKDKDYDWRQINNAIRQVVEEGVKLEPFQQAELTSIGQPPIESLPDLFQSFDRIMQLFRGNK